MNIWRSLFKMGACYMELEFSADEFFVAGVSVQIKNPGEPPVQLASYLFAEQGQLDGHCIVELAPQSHECDEELVL